MKISGGVRDVIIFAGGLIVGGVSSLFACKKYYRKKANDEIESVERAFTERLNEIEEEKRDALDVAEEALLSANDYHREDPGARELIKNRSTLDGILKSKKADRVDYVTYAKNSKETIEVDDHPTDDEPEEDEDYGSDSNEAIMELGNGRDHIKEPYEINYREYGSLPTYDFKELYYYQGDNTLVDAEGDSEDIIDNPEYLVGDVLVKSGYTKNDEKSIYIRNEYSSCDFEVMKVFASYSQGG